ncbi:MAG: hypothetical protein KA112_00895 [Alphaproteobacteria bacterium]|jgi:hypothetical protein|nr:hypothetical protein [Alphaproteobacteria bacterium]MBP7729159.1 hypothetical protein [Alphaproteobacteria bacterium]
MVKFKSLTSTLILTTLLSTGNVFAMVESEGDFSENEQSSRATLRSPRDIPFKDDLKSAGTSLQSLGFNPSETIENGHSVYSMPTAEEGYVEAKTRLCILKEVLKINPDMTINTRVPSADLLWPLYQTDKSFIEKSIVSRSNNDMIQDSINYLHGIALKAKWNSSMSISDLNWIGKVWVYLLSTSPESQKHALANEYGENILRGPEGINELMKYLKQHNIDQNFQEYVESDSRNTWRKSHGFVMPIISPTGAFPLSVLRESWSFFRQDGHQIATYLDFSAVPTDALVNFDYGIAFPPCDAWTHDNIHWKKYRFLEQDDALANAKQMATMLQNLENARLDISELNRFDIAFFHVFHESQVPLPLDYLLYRIDTLKLWAKRATNSEIIPVPNSFNSVEQYKNLVDSTEFLGIHLEGEDLIEKYRSYLKILLEGLGILETFACTIDEDSCIAS